jgi:hypothetical protein
MQRDSEAHPRAPTYVLDSDLVLRTGPDGGLERLGPNSMQESEGLMMAEKTLANVVLREAKV